MIRQFATLILLLALSAGAQAQGYAAEIAAYRKNYKEDFVKESRSPLKAKDTAFLRFYPPNESYAVWADLKLTPDAPIFEMLTHSGTKQDYRQYAVATFILGAKTYRLSIYQSLRLIKTEAMQYHLFLPFNDLTNYETSYAGGRYLDLNSADIQDNKIWLDFNKCYNPYCAYKEGYSCPIPPVENRLLVRIEAGEQLFAGKVSE